MRRERTPSALIGVEIARPKARKRITPELTSTGFGAFGPSPRRTISDTNPQNDGYGLCGRPRAKRALLLLLVQIPVEIAIGDYRVEGPESATSLEGYVTDERGEVFPLR